MLLYIYYILIGVSIPKISLIGLIIPGNATIRLRLLSWGILLSLLFFSLNSISIVLFSHIDEFNRYLSMFIMIPFVYLIGMSRSNDDLKIILLILSSLFLIISLFSIINTVLYEESYIFFEQRRFLSIYKSLLDDPYIPTTHLSNFGILIIPLLAHYKSMNKLEKLITVIVFILYLFIGIYSQTRTPTLLVLLFILIHNLKKLSLKKIFSILFLLVVISVVAFVFPELIPERYVNEGVNTPRLLLWAFGLKTIYQNPLGFYGHEIYAAGEIHSHIHNTFLDIARYFSVYSALSFLVFFLFHFFIKIADKTINTSKNYFLITSLLLLMLEPVMQSSMFFFLVFIYLLGLYANHSRCNLCS